MLATSSITRRETALRDGDVVGVDVVFDLALDRGGWPGPAAASGVAWLGPLGLADRLELELGLPRRQVPPLLRAMQVARSLATRDGFWSASLAIDRLATAERLLSDRDRLAMDGWSGEPVSDRLAALWDATAHAASAMPDRLARIAAALSHRTVALASIQTFTPLDELPARWAAVFAALARGGTRIATCALPAHLPGMVSVLRAHGPLAAAEDIAAWLAAMPDLEDTLVIGPDTTLSAACTRHGLPALGASDATGSGVLLGLCMETAFRPMDAVDLHALICADPGPVPRAVARRLARALARFPGRDNATWHHALAEGLATLEPDRREVGAERLQALLVPVVDRGAALTRSQLEARVEALRAWAQPRVREHPSLLPLFAQADMLVELARAYGEPITLLELRRWLRAIPRPETGRAPAQAGISVVSEPAAVLGTPARAIWWGCVRSRIPVVTRLRLTRDERAALAARGVNVPTAALSAARVAARWRRVLGAASVVLVAPRHTEVGDVAQPHPIVDELAGAQVPDTLDPPRTRVPLREVPAALASVRVTPVAPLSVGSASSVELLLGCSLAYALRYRADLQRGMSAPIARPGALLAGQLAHELFARELAAGGADLTLPTRLAQRFECDLPGLAETLVLPDHQVERAAVRRALVRAAEILARAIESSGARLGGVELPLEGQLGNLGISSRADLVLADPSYVVDYKWGSSASRAKLADGTAVQLAVYAALASARGAAYLLLRGARLIGYAGLEGVEVTAGPPLADVHAATLRALSVRLEELATGLLVAPGTDGSTGRSRLVDGTLAIAPPCGFCAFDGLCGRRAHA